MEARKLIENGGSQQEFEAALRTLAQTIREAGECMLDLEQALQLLHLSNDPKLALAVHVETSACLRKAMGPSRR